MNRLFISFAFLISFGISSCCWLEPARVISYSTCGAGRNNLVKIDYTKKIEFISLIPWMKDTTITPAQIVGGPDSLISKMTYPEVAYKHGIVGRVIVEFNVDSGGYAKNIYEVKSLGAQLEDEVIKAVKSQKFIPAKKNGNIISQIILLSIKFDLVEI